MKRVRVYFEGKKLWDHAELAQYPWERMQGLLGRARISENEAMILPKTGSIHTFFMRFAIDVAFLDRHKRIVKLVTNLKPGNLSAGLKACYAVEMKEGLAQKIPLYPGQQFFWDEKAQVTLEFVLIIAVFILGVITAIPPMIRAFQQHASQLLYYMSDI